MNGKNRPMARLWIVGGLVATTILAGPSAMATQPATDGPKIAFAIDRGPLQQALVAFAATTGMQLLYASDLVANRIAPPLVGGFTPADALERLLAGTGLSARKVADRVFVLEARTGAGAQTADPNPAGDTAGNESAAPIGPEDRTFVSSNEPLAPARPTSVATPDILVTGSHIRGANPGTPPIVQINRDDLTRNGHATVAQALQALPGNFSGTASEQSALSFADTTGSNASLATGVNLRGLGAGATLVLVNGQRVGGSGTDGSFGDTSMIPTGAFDHAEVLLDGASAIYGSDAVGGVVNILLRRRFEGAETRLRFGAVTEGGKRDVQASQTLGTRWATGGVMVSYEFDRAGRLASADRRFARSSDLRPLGGTDHRLIYSLPGNLLSIDPATGILGVAYAIPAGQDGTRLTPADFRSGPANLQNTRIDTDLLPRQTRHSVYGSLDQDITDTITLSSDIRYARRAFDARLPGAVAVVQVSPANPFFVSPTGARSDIVAYSLAQEVGPMRSHGFAEAFAVSGSLDADLGAGWKIRSYGAFAQERERNLTDHMVNNTALNEAVGLTPDDPSTPFSAARDGYFNPFGSGSSNAAATMAFIGNGFNDVRVRTRVITAHADADGTLFDLPGGPIKLAIGADARRETFSTHGTGRRGGVGTRSLFDIEDARTVSAGFAELRVPVIGDGNTRTGLHRLDLSLAGRIEHYPRFGTTANPKLGISWEPVGGVALRAGWGTSFRAPNLRQLGDAQRYSVTTLTSADRITIPVIQLSGGNPELAPEKARSWTTGIDLAPAGIPGLSFHATWFDTVFRQRIATPANENFANALLDPSLAPFVQRLAPSTNPADLNQIQTLLRDPAFTGSNPFPVTTIGAIVDTRYVNTGRVTVSGLDLAGGYRFEAGRDRFDLNASATYLAHYREQVTSTSTFVSRRNLVGRPVDFRGRATAGWSRGIVNAQVGLNHVAGYRDLTDRRIEAWDTVDLEIGLSVPTAAPTPSAGTTIAVAVSNLLNAAPPFYDNPQGIGYDAANANALGRFVSIQLTRRW